MYGGLGVGDCGARSSLDENRKLNQLVADISLAKHTSFYRD